MNPTPQLHNEMHELPIRPRGLLWQTDFITPSHEQHLLHIFRHELTWPDRPGRISLHYGYTFDYKTFNIDPDIPYRPFPDWLVPLLPARESRPPDQVCLQYYPPGAGIPPHVDAHGPYDQLYALSLGAPVMMQFRRGEERVEVDCEPRSLMCMSGEARLLWTHGIKKRKTDLVAGGAEDGEGGTGEGQRVRVRGERWSITYRWLREGGECECGDVELCDTAQRRLGVEKEKRSVVALREAAEEEEKRRREEKGGGRGGEGGES
ncbi:2OG-Fe(II) oxygenase family oxidoreductase [Aspergillus saccharolyticus JOP 1030-1]|uniref:2OG-Fe(II) oxygenase family oxidoreductase n=1 Tax=Aspergillus saccharolyticus JOP 1030-1 TaxID=1450539 RepID=A0A318Z6X8_9EURO|nr:2OG-Fe(II) oxygenase family oxidoreductase [Aspergillus saccharolyticus JOP 1030-1]PYH43081.1 2OG-Fe(II) oxygenase family oxidoreductase [Aspergillus saccharolyticus JOP 1030-1]